MEHYPVEILTPPASEPVVIADLKAALRLNTGTAEDAELTRFVKAARELFERTAKRPVLPTAFRQWLPKLCGPIELARGPVLAVQAVKYWDYEGDLQDLDGYQVDAAELPAVVYLPGGDYPAVSTTRRRPAYVEFTAGWANTAAVPKAVVTAITLLAGHFYRYREATTAENPKDLPYGFRAICDQYATGLGWGG